MKRWITKRELKMLVRKLTVQVDACANKNTTLLMHMSGFLDAYDDSEHGNLEVYIEKFRKDVSRV